jgi:hypothetical protein
MEIFRVNNFHGKKAMDLYAGYPSPAGVVYGFSWL